MIYVSPTNYTTTEDYLFLFIANQKLITPATIFYDYNVTGVWKESPSPTA